MKKLTSNTYTAQATIGLHKDYTSELISLKDFKKALVVGQKKVNEALCVQLSTKITPCEIVFLGQEEASVTLDFIQYPKFPVEENLLKNAVIYLVEFLMDTLCQNRTVIVFSDETICLEKTEALDPKINI